MSYFDNVYKLRVNRYGIDYQSRVQGEREKLFDLYLMKTLYRVEFRYNDEIILGSFEKYKQDETETLHYLLTRTDIEIPNGTVLMIPDKDLVEQPWMVYYLEQIKASGYNRYIMLKMSHYVSWIGRDSNTYGSWVYMYGQENNMLKDEIRSRSRMDAIYAENLKSSFFVMPRNANLRKDDYLIVGERPYQEYYRVTGYDWQSSEGVGYVTVDPIYEYDLTPAPEKTELDNDEDFYWLERGDSDGA